MGWRKLDPGIDRLDGAVSVCLGLVPLFVSFHAAYGLEVALLLSFTLAGGGGLLGISSITCVEGRSIA
jgi:hypothetical protein